MTIEFNTQPYFDDYDEEKNFHRILFKPAVAVQARELNQLQTILQNQIARFGRHVFKEGAMVIPGQASVDTTAQYVKIGAVSNIDSIEDLVGTLIYGNTSGLVAKVVAVAESADVDPNTLIVKYMDSGETSGTTTAFTAGESLRQNSSRTTAVATVAASAATGGSSVAQIEEGIYFIGGLFVRVDQQVLILDKYSSVPTYRVGLSVDEQIATAADDGTLVDNALGSYNYAAPGADRYKVVLTLAKLSFSSTDDQDFIELIRVEDGQILSQIQRTEYSVLEQTLARRTFDESGDYTVRPFQIQPREWRDNNRGDWSASTITYVKGDIVAYSGNAYTCISDHTSTATTPAAAPSLWIVDANPAYNRGVTTVTAAAGETGEAANLAIGLEPGKAYVRGYEIEKISTEYLKIPKSRTYVSVGNDLLQTQVGNFVYVTNLANYFNTTSFGSVDLYDRLTTTRGSAAGTRVGTAKVRYIEYYSGTIGSTSAVYRLSLFDVNMLPGKTFERNVKQIFASSSTADVISTSVVPQKGTITVSGTAVTGVGTNFLTTLLAGDYIVGTGNTGAMRVATITSDLAATVDTGLVGITGGAFGIITAPFSEVNNSSLVFKLPQVAIKATSDMTVKVLQRYSTTPAAGVGTIGAAPASGGGTTSGSSFESTNPSDYIAIDTVTGNVAAITNVTLVGATANLTGFSTTNQHQVFAKVLKTGGALQLKTKTITIGSKSVTSANAAATAIALDVADVYKIDSIVTSTGIDITNQYVLDDGQRPTHYGISRIIRKSDYGPPSAALTVNFRYFTHVNTGDYFSVESYSGIRYEDIPSFSYGGVSIRLSDALDFRPRIDNTGTDFTSTGSSISALPARDRTVQLDYDYYVGRKDKIAIDPAGNFFSIQGVPALQPMDPADPNNAMVLYKVSLGPYTVGTSDLRIDYIDNKRYTMRDIGKLEKRIQNLEYYTALSLLEQDTKSFTILDGDGFDRYKNGFIVDNFEGHGVGDVTQPDYLCSVDMERKQLRPFFRLDNFNLIYTGKTNIQITGEVATLPYTSVVLIEQPYASTTENVNPYNVFKFIGDMRLYPEVDEWFEVNRLPDVITNEEGNFDSVRAQLEAQGVLGTVWNSWQTQWTGVPVSQGSTTQTITATGTPEGWPRQDITTETFAQQTGLARTGINTTVVAKVETRVVGDRTVSTAVIPYIRSRKVVFVAKGLKPFTKFYPFFEGSNVSAYVTPATKLTLTANVGKTFDVTTNAGSASEEAARRSNGASEIAFNRGDKVYSGSNTAIAVHVDRNAVYVVNMQGNLLAGQTITGSLSGNTATISSVALANVAEPMISSALGDVAGVFYIPNTTSVRFRTGIREYILNSSANNSQQFSSYARARYTATGTLENKQTTIASVRNAQIVTQEVSATKTITQQLQRVDYSDWYDPLAQTFLVQQDGGAFLTKVDLFFASRDDVTNVPVRMEIREVVNGYPGKTVLPFSKVVKPAAEVNVSNVAATATTFEFSSPVFVENGVEYAVVVLSDSDEYNVWIAQMGQTTIEGDRTISQQPYLGTLFKSQNASTWTAEQSQDLKFTIYRASFSPLSGNITFVNDRLPIKNLPTNPFLTSNTTSQVKVYHPNHGFRSGSNVTFSGALGTPSSNLALVNINKSFLVSNVFPDFYTINTANIANVSGLTGGSNVWATQNQAFDAIQPVIETMLFQGTSLDFYARATDYTANTLDSFPGTAVIPNNTNPMALPKVVYSADNDGDNGLSKSFRLEAYMVSTKENLSPVIDLNRMSVISVKNKVNLPTRNNYNIGSVIDNRTIVAGNVQIGFAGNVIYGTTAPIQTILKTINPGRELVITGTGNVANNCNVIVSSVDKNTGNVTVKNYTFVTSGAANAITLVSKDGFVDEIAPTGGSVLSKYMTRQVNLTTPASVLKVIFSGSIPPGTDVDLYYKTLPAGSYLKMSEIEFFLGSPSKTVTKTLDENLFSDVEYLIENIPEFTSLVVKLVFRVDPAYSSFVPKVKDLRVIACS